MERLTAVVVVTHGNAGADMIAAAQAFLHMRIPHLAAVGIEPEDNRDVVDRKIDQALDALGVTKASNEDVLFLVDLVGSTPARLCCSKCGGGHVVTGVNMPMLLKLATADRTRGATALGNELVVTGTKSIHCE
jgi:mannose/fructose-specific phosphotransferase system component IIA